MAYEEITSPIALDESFNTTENTSRNIADVLADELSNLADAVKPDAGDIALDTISGMSANNVQDGIEELKQSLDDIADISTFTLTVANKTGTSDCAVDTQRNYVQNNVVYVAITLHSGSNTSDIELTLPNNITFKQYGHITIVGKGTRWSVTAPQYIYVGEHNLSLNTISANSYYHIMLSLPVNVT